MEINIDYLNKFEEKLEKELLKTCTDRQMLQGTLLQSDDIDAHWEKLAPEYVADAVKEIADYPDVAVAWAAYLGTAIATGWDTNWPVCQATPYTAYYGPQGFDDMDDHIKTDILGLSLNSPEASTLDSLFLTCSEISISRIRHEHIEPQSPLSFHIFARTIKTMYRIGAAVQLGRMGYKMERIG